MKKISAAAISRIISSITDEQGEKIRKAPKSGWGKGFYVVGYDVAVTVYYQDTDQAVVEEKLNQIVETLNGRADKKYFAKIESLDSTDYRGSLVVKVVVRDENNSEHVAEPKAEETPEAVTVQEVRRALLGPCYEYTSSASGFVAERCEENPLLVRVFYRDHPHTRYTLVEGGRDAHMHASVEHYADLLANAGFSVCVDYDPERGDSVLVGPAGHFQGEEDPEAIKEALLALREKIEDAELAFMTRKAGPNSLFIYYLVPFKDKVRRLEVSYGHGQYRSVGRFGNSRMATLKGADEVVEFARAELAD